MNWKISILLKYLSSWIFSKGGFPSKNRLSSFWQRNFKLPPLPDLDGLTDFAMSPDKDHARFFVGQHDIIKDINHAWQWRMQKWQENRKTNAFKTSTRIIQGVLGAGKTSVATRLAYELWYPSHQDSMFIPASNKSSIVLELDSGLLNNPMVVFPEIFRCIKPRSEKKLQAETTTSGYILR